MKKNTFLGVTGKYDSLGIINGFREFTELYIEQLVGQGKWFTLCHKIDPRQEDIMKLENNKGVTLGKMISETFEECSYRTSIYKYMLMNFMCYVEYPKLSYRTDMGERRETFEKILVTSSVGVIADWLGVEVEELPEKYTSRVWAISVDDGYDDVPYVKLVETKEGKRRVICPKKDLDLGQMGTRVVPVFMLKRGVDALNESMKKDIVKVEFLKDGGQLRDMFTTTSFSRIKDIYGVGTFYDESVMGAYDGDFLGNKYLARGFIRVPEIGGSRYGNPTRSINYSRIVSIEYDVEPDLSFINIDLSTVVDGFMDGVSSHLSEAKDIIGLLEAFGIDGKGYWRENSDGNKKFPVKNGQTLIEWVEERNMLFSTVFERELCQFMLANPQWFGGFDGKPKYEMGSHSSDVGLL